jgi:hypothetical protein
MRVNAPTHAHVVSGRTTAGGMNKGLCTSTMSTGVLLLSPSSMCMFKPGATTSVSVASPVLSASTPFTIGSHIHFELVEFAGSVKNHAHALRESKNCRGVCRRLTLGNQRACRARRLCDRHACNRNAPIGVDGDILTRVPEPEREPFGRVTGMRKLDVLNRSRHKHQSSCFLSEVDLQFHGRNAAQALSQ